MSRPDVPADVALAAPIDSGVRQDKVPAAKAQTRPQALVVLNEPPGRRIPALLILVILAFTCLLSLRSIYADAPKPETAPAISHAKAAISVAVNR